MFCAHWKLESDANKWLKGKDFSHCLWFTDSLDSRGTYLETNNEVDFSWCGTYNNCVFSDLYFLFLWLCLYCVPSSALVPHSSLPSLRSLLKCCSSLSATDWITVFLSPFLPFLHSLSMWGCCPPLSKTHQSTWTSHGRQKKKEPKLFHIEHFTESGRIPLLDWGKTKVYTQHICWYSQHNGNGWPVCR